MRGINHPFYRKPDKSMVKIELNETLRLIAELSSNIKFLSKREISRVLRSSLLS